MKKIILFIYLIFCNAIAFGIPNEETNFLYEKYTLSDKLDYRIFKYAINGYEKIDNKNNKYLIIIDYSKSSDKKRFFLLNTETKELDTYTYVSHGKNSGVDMAITFSNKLNSYKSSLGFYLTGKSYYGKYGYSIKLYGLEDKFNSNAEVRHVVIHGFKEAEESYVKRNGFLGRTEGCPAIPKSLTEVVIKKIEKDSVVFIFANDKKYLEDSYYLK